MSIDCLLRIAFQDGCGVSLPETILSARQAPSCPTFQYWRLAERLASPACWGKPVRLPTAYHSLCTLREVGSLSRLGETLVNQARSFLPLSILHRAQEWPRLSPSMQSRLARRLVRWIERKYVGDLKRRTLAEMLEDARKPYDERRLFPRYWGLDGATPNCLGMLLLLVCFAQHTGARFRIVSVLQMNSSLLAGITGALYGMAKEDLEGRYIVWDEELLDQMQERIERGNRPGLGITNFHHSLAIQLSDESWFYLDPNTLTCGPVPVQWRLNALDCTLQEIQQAFPGLALQTGYSGGYDGFRQRYVRQLRDAICYSRQLEEALSELLADWLSPWQPIDIGDEEDVFDVYQEHVMTHPAWQFLDHIHPANDGTMPLVQSLSSRQRKDPKIRFQLATLMVGHSPTLDTLEAERQRFRCEPEYREQCVRHLLARYHFWTISRYFRAIPAIVARNLHPWVEVNACPHHAIGLFVLNSLRHARRQTAVTRLLDHTSSQIIGREVLRNTRASSRVKDRLASYLGSLPVLHTLVEHTLDAYGEEQKHVRHFGSGIPSPG